MSQTTLAAVTPTAICFDNQNGYNNPTLHMWNSFPAGAVTNTNWPGKNMAAENTFYCYDSGVALTSLNVIFSDDGNQQTEDLLLTSPNNCWQNNQWKTLSECGLITANAQPNADAGSDITVAEGASVTFDASASSDVDGNIVNYAWSNQLTGINPSMVYSNAGSYVVTLTVTDNQGATSTDTVTITVTSTTATSIAATSICYDNTANYAVPTIYLWDSTPAAALANFNWPGETMTKMSGAQANYYCYDPSVELTSMQVIFNGYGNNSGNGQTNDLVVTPPNSCYKNNAWTSLASCGFAVEQPGNIPPTANAGDDFTITVGQTANFNGSASTDSDGTITNYNWSNGLTGVSASQVYTSPGTYVVTLTVTDNDNESAQDNITVTVVAAPTYNFPTSKAIYYINDNNWNAPTAYIWQVLPADSIADGQWPGQALTDFGGLNAWFIEIDDNAQSGNVIFNNNGANQSADLNFSGDLLCYNNGVWMTIAACNIPQTTNSSADAGGDRTVNINSKIALTAVASSSSTKDATWQSSAWSGELNGANVVTPTITTAGTFEVTLTLTDGDQDTFSLTVVNATQGIAERQQLAAPLNFPLSGNVSSSNYEYESAFPALDGSFISPVMVTNDGLNDLIYIVDKSGKVLVFPNDPTVTPAQVNTLLDISNEVRDYHEQGLLSIAFHPNFATNRLAYIYYIEGDNDNESDNGVFGDGVLERITLDDASNPTIAESRIEVLRIPQPGPDHKGSMMQFHPSTGEFYMSLGDGAYGDTALIPTQPDPRTNNSAQETTNLRGSIIRLIMRETPNVNGKYYDIPSDNPFVNDDSVRDEIWSFGHRNPWRFSFDHQAPYTLWQTEVGQAGFEEVNIIQAGGNYGWPICEGNTHRGNDGGDPNNSRSCSGDLIAPVGGYTHDTGSVSIIGGFVYRGTALPALTGRFIYGDYVSKKIWSAVEGDPNKLVSDAFPSNISSFGTDMSGEEVFVTSHGVEYGGLSILYRMIDSEAQAAVIPAKLSNTGIFADLITQTPVHGVIEYDVNSDGWFDGLKARHFFAIPNESNIEFNEDEVWNLPVGSVLVKHLSLPVNATNTTPFETSVLFKQVSGKWASANYRWNPQGTDADLVNEAFNETVAQYYNGATTNVNRQVRSGAECTSCHLGTGSKEPLAITTAQLNRDLNYQGVVSNQVDLFNQLGLFTNTIAGANSLTAYPDPEDTSADIDNRARAYLSTNCAHCHDGSLMDLNYDTPVNQMDIMNIQRSGVYRMLPFDHAASLIHIYQTDDANRMPKGSVLTNPLADDLIAAWIDGQTATQTGMEVTVKQSPIVPNSQVTLSSFGLYDNGFKTIPITAVEWVSSDTSVIDPIGSSATINTIAGNTGVTTVWASNNGYVGSIDIAVVGAPNQPTNFSATSTSADSITLTWNDNADNEQNYLLSRSTNTNGPFAPLITLNQNSNAFIDTGLEVNTLYYYQLIAVAENANSLAVTASTSTQDTGSIDSIELISNQTTRLIAGETKQLVAVAHAGDITRGITLGASWISSNTAIVNVSSAGLLTAGNTAGTADITINYQGKTDNITVTNIGAGQYAYFNVPSNWDTPMVYIWTNENGTETDRSAAWPGTDLTEIATEFGGTWLRFSLPTAWANSNGNVNIIFSNNEANQTENLTVGLANPSWYDNGWLAQAPSGNGVETGGQVQVGNGSVHLNGSDNLSGKLFTRGTVVDINANSAGTGLEFSGWEGSGIAYLVDPSQANTQLVIGDAFSYTLLAVFDSVNDPYVQGRTFFNEQGCTGCHGTAGDSGTSLLNVANNYSLSQLTNYIENNMPIGNAAACTGDCASSTADMILAGAYSAPANMCNATDLNDLIPQDRSYRLLSTLEYNNSIRDLLGLANNVDVTSGRIPADIPVNGFKTNANTLFTNDYAKGYVIAAETAANMVNNIYDLTSGCSDITCFITTFGKRAFRRPLTPDEVADLTAVYTEHGDIGVLSAMLSAPAMLYRSEVGEANGSGYYELTDYEVAAMLSYTYWATTPDANLMAKAEAGELSTPAQIAATVSNMLQDPKAKSAFERFISGWLDLDKEIKTPELSDSLKADMKQETIEFVRRTVFEGGQYNDLLTANYSFMTQQLATHYGLQWPGGSDWQKVNYISGDGEQNGNSERRGILGHAGILTLQSASEKTHPVKRGLFVRRNLMCQDFPPPPIGAILKPQEDPSLTVRERFENAHLQDGCESCHQYIDGIGFGLENYNEVGLFTTTETTDDGQVKVINSAGYIGSLYSAETFLSASDPVVPYQGLDELAQLVADSAHGKACYARQWYRYMRGQRESNEDSCTVQVFGQLFKDGANTSMLDLMIQFTQTKNYTLRK
ncbi:starch-binding protein [Colwellia sp. E2M01]|uniref:starch-binding protein n=1 Tax=Colwellia sp. E2M01 TaxID=2841561 RepID=UPI001C09D9F7|nr:starch-binding protein [Colwellia sp. E2M01]MBU2870086.1 starch-binding protein [Colwellia sp. E2M01]